MLIVFESSTGNSIQGNLIGTDVTGSYAIGGAEVDGIAIVAASGNTIGGSGTAARNIISGNNGQGIRIDNASANEVRGNFIGTDASGTLPLGNGQVDFHSGIVIHIGAANNSVIDNVISANSADGISLFDPGTTGNIIQGNFIGTDVTGTASLGNGGSGVAIEVGAAGNFIGGTPQGARNLISGNGFVGIAIRTSGGNVMEGNFIGTDVSGTAHLGNAIVGIDILNSSNNQIGGPDVGARNVISGNGLWGVAINASASTGNRVQGNLIGTDVTGSYAIGGAEVDGIAIEDSPGNTIGGVEPAARNLISGNDGQGIHIYGNNASGNEVRGNYIGTDATGTLPLGNGRVDFHSGIVIHIGAANNSILDNVIAANSADGVSLWDEGTTGNTVQGNFIGTDATGTLALGNAFSGVVIANDATGNSILSNVIRSNGGLGIDLGGDGVTLNDARDRDSGPNGLQNFPLLSPPVLEHGSLKVAGTLSSQPNSTYRIELFGVAACDESGYGEGDRFLGFLQVTTGPSGGAPFVFDLPPDFPLDHFVTATATDASGSTSEFSRCAGPAVRLDK